MRSSCCTSRKAQARALAEAGYRPPLPPRNMPVAGKTGIATLQMMLVNMRDGGFISPYDFEIGLAHRAGPLRRRGRTRAASSTRSGCSISSAREFMALLRNAKTQERIAHTLDHRQAAAELTNP